jgi:hypothetical protein
MTKHSEIQFRTYSIDNGGTEEIHYKAIYSTTDRAEAEAEFDAMKMRRAARWANDAAPTKRKAKPKKGRAR